MYNVTPSAVGVIVYKVVGNRFIEKRVNLRTEHVRHSKCRQEFLDRVKANRVAHEAAKEKGGKSCIRGFDAGGMTPFPFRSGIPETHSCTTTRGTQCLYLRKCTSDHCTSAIRDNNLEDYVMLLLHITHCMSSPIAIMSMNMQKP